MNDGYTGQHFAFELDELVADAEKRVDELRESGRNKASTEWRYRVELAKKMWELKAGGVPATGMSDLARGDEDIAMLKFYRDAAETDFKASQEALNVAKLKIRVVSDQIAREWGRPSNM